MAVTIKDIARKANVSITSVSRVLNNKAKGVSEETRNKILKIVEEENYIPNAVAKGLVTKKTNILGLIIPDITNPYYPEIAKGIEDTANERGYNIILCGTNSMEENEHKYIRILKEHYVAGIIYNSSHYVSESTFKELDATDIPYVFIENTPRKQDKMRVYTDGEIGMEKLIDYLISMGHKKIAFLSGPEQSYTVKARLEGYKKALSKHGLAIYEDLIKYGESTRAGGYEMTKALLKEKAKFTAIACFNDLMAVGALQKLHEKGIGVPVDISVTGYDNVYVTKITTPKITTVEQPAYDMGCEAAKILIDNIENNKKPTKAISFEPKLKIRESVKKL